MGGLLVLAGLVLASPAAGAAEAGRAPAAGQATAAIDASYPRLFALYKDIHAHPELGFHETRTAALLAAEMRKLGLAVTEHVGGTGIVAMLRNGDGPTVLLRTELDALPMEEKTGLPYASKVQTTEAGATTFVAHSCGHDAHMAWWVGAAQALVAMKDRWHGTLLFVGQPAEELGKGAQAMLADGLLTRFPRPDYAIAAHVGPLPATVVFLKDGTVTSAADMVKITFKGRGAHGSTPSASIDPIVMAAHFVADVQTVVSREKDAGAFGVVTVGSFIAGTAGNIIPDHADLQLSLRSYTPEVRKVLNEGVDRTARAAAAMAGAPAPEITRSVGLAAVKNDTPLVGKLAAGLRPVFGDRLVLAPAAAAPGPMSEDFSAYGDAGIPSAYLLVGGYDPTALADYKARGVPVPVNHSPFFAPSPEPTIKAGATALTLAVLALAGTAAPAR